MATQIKCDLGTEMNNAINQLLGAINRNDFFGISLIMGVIQLNASTQ